MARKPVELNAALGVGTRTNIERQGLPIKLSSSSLGQMASKPNDIEDGGSFRRLAVPRTVHDDQTHRMQSASATRLVRGTHHSAGRHRCRPRTMAECIDVTGHSSGQDGSIDGCEKRDEHDVRGPNLSFI
jgi:hypothetical protein